MDYYFLTLVLMEDKDYLKNIGKRIAEARKAKGMTQMDLCSIINMDKPNLSAIENGRQNATALTLKKISDALEVDVQDFFK